MSSGQQILEDMENRLEEAKKRYRNTLEVIKIIEKKIFFFLCYDFRRTESGIKAEKTNQLLGQVKTGVEHLAEKLKHIKIVSH